jgi:hypothetical protein
MPTNHKPIHNKEHIRKKIIRYLWKRSAKHERDISFKTRQLPTTCNPTLTTKILKENYVGTIIKQINHPKGTRATTFKTQFWRKNTQ